MDEEARSAGQGRLERQLHLLYGERVGELRALTEAELIEKHDAHVDEARGSNKVGVRLQWLERAQVYADELARRDTEAQGMRLEALTRSMQAQGERMEDLTSSLNGLTWWIVGLTVLIAFVTVLGVGLTAWALFIGG
jgi:hypothetical protein